MYVFIIFFAILSIIVLKEITLYFKIRKKTIDFVAFRLLSRFNYLILIQIFTLFWQFVIRQDIELFPIWMLLFLFYGPYLFLILHHFLFKVREKFLAVYFKDYYLSLCLFIGFSSMIFYMIEDLRFNRNLWLYFFYVFIVVHLLFYSIKGFYVLKNILIDESVDKKRDFKLIKYISYLISFVLIFSIIIFVFLTLFKNNYDVLFIFSTITLLWFYVIISLFRQQVYQNVFSVENLNSEGIEINDYSEDNSEIIIENRIKETTKGLDCFEYQIEEDNIKRDTDYDESKYEKVRLSTDFLNQLDIKVQQVIINEKAFQDPHFKISDLAAKTKVSRYYLAQYFTYMHNMNFREYINSLRIEEILNQIQNRDKEDQISVNELFFQSAFNSKASFFKSFKNVTGMTPTEYMRVI